MVVNWLLSTRLIKANFCFALPLMPHYSFFRNKNFVYWENLIWVSKFHHYENVYCTLNEKSHRKSWSNNGTLLQRETSKMTHLSRSSGCSMIRAPCQRHEGSIPTSMELQKFYFSNCSFAHSHWSNYHKIISCMGAFNICTLSSCVLKLAKNALLFPYPWTMSNY